MKNHNRFSFFLAPVLTLGLLQGCKGVSNVVESFDLTLGDNSVTLSSEFSQDFALNLNGVYDLVIKGTDYGEVFLYGASADRNFTAGINVDVGVFAPENWDGFAPTDKLPNGSSLPSWIEPRELVFVDIPTTSSKYELSAYVGYQGPYYLGVSLGMSVIDDHFPEGLSLSQSLRKNGVIWGEVMAYGPVRGEGGEIISHGGIFIVAKYDPNSTDLRLGDNLEPSQWEAHGKEAQEYQNNPKKMKKLLKELQNAVDEFNRDQE